MRHKQFTNNFKTEFEGNTIVNRNIVNRRSRMHEKQNFEDMLRVLSLSEDSRKLIQTLSNETSIKILQLLDSGNMSASDLAERLKLRLNTLHYHLDALLEAGLIRVDEIKWSQKGRKIKIYAKVEKMIVLVPGKGIKEREAMLALLRECLVLS